MASSQLLPKERLTTNKTCDCWIQVFNITWHFKCYLKCLMSRIHFKGAVCRILTLLKHKNTIICLQIFKKHAKLTYLFIWKTMLQSVILLWKCAFRPGMSVCYGLWNPPTASLPNCISIPRVASWRKTHFISFHSSSCALVPVGFVNLATCVCVKSEEEGLVKKTLSNILNLNPTYSTFKAEITWIILKMFSFVKSL